MEDPTPYKAPTPEQAEAIKKGLLNAQLLPPEVCCATVPRVTRLTLGRVYNLGNYENLRVEVQVEVPTGSSATAAFVTVERLLSELGESCPVEEYDYNAAMERAALTDEEWKGKFGAERWEAEKLAAIGEFREIADPMHLWKLLQERARNMLDKLNATYTGKDHKLDWENYED